MKEIITYPNSILKEKSETVKIPLSKEDRKLLDEMYSYVKSNNESAVGLSAVQVGVLKTMCAVVYDNFRYKLVNPRIIKYSVDYQYCKEGCLSVKENYEEPVKRYKSVTVAAYDAITNKNVIINASGFEAIILQHEIDHMNGILFMERIVK